MRKNKVSLVETDVLNIRSQLSAVNLTKQQDDISGDFTFEYEAVNVGQNISSLDPFRNPSTVKLGSISLFNSMSRDATNEDTGIQIIYYSTTVADQLNLLGFKSRKLPIIADSSIYSAAYEHAAIFLLKSVRMRLKSVSAEQRELMERKCNYEKKEAELLKGIEELEGNLPLIERPKRAIQSLNLDLDRVVARLLETNRSIRENERLQGELQEKIREDIDKSNLKAIAHYERENLALSRLKEAVHDFFSVIEKIVAQYPVILAILSKRQSDSMHPGDDPEDHFKARHLWMFFDIMERKFLNGEDDLSSMVILLRAVNPQETLSSETAISNYHLNVVRILKSKGKHMVTVEDLNAVLIVLKLTPERRAEFLKWRQLQRDVQKGYSGSDYGSVSDGGPCQWMDQVQNFLEQHAELQQQVKSLKMAGASQDEVSKTRLAGHRAEKDLRNNHSQAFAAVGELCKDFMRGRCTFGEACRYSHDVRGAQQHAGSRTDKGVHFDERPEWDPSDSDQRKPKNRPVPPNVVKIPPATMWDDDGWICCFRGPYFLDHRDGPCPNTGYCPYSHNAPVTLVKPAFRRNQNGPDTRL